MATLGEILSPADRARLDALAADGSPNPPEEHMNTPEPQTIGIDVALDVETLDWVDQLARQARPPLTRDQVVTELMEDAIARGWRPRPEQVAALAAQEEASRL